MEKRDILSFISYLVIWFFFSLGCREKAPFVMCVEGECWWMCGKILFLQ